MNTDTAKNLECAAAQPIEQTRSGTDKMRKAIDSWQNRYFELRTQRDELLSACQRVEAHSRFNNKVDGYVVDEGAMNNLCLIMGKTAKQIKRLAANTDQAPNDYKASAEKLAEALRELVSVVYPLKCDDTIESYFVEPVRKALTALANWQKEAQ